MGQMILDDILEMATRRGLLRATAILALTIGLAWPAAAVEVYRSEKANVNIDTTITMGLGLRVGERDETIFFKGNDPNNPQLGSEEFVFSNADDGNLNYDQFDIYSANAKTTVDIEAAYKVDNSILTDVGAFIRFSAFYDVIGNCRHCTRRTTLPEDSARSGSVIDGGVVGTQFLFLDAYADARFEVYDRLVDFRFGNQVLSWGESLFIPGGANATNGVDVAKLRVPGSDLKEAFVPAPIIRLNADIIDNLSIEGYYQFWWNRTQVDPVGSYFATSDLVGRGASRLYFGNDAGSGCPTAPFPGLPTIDPVNCTTNVYGVPQFMDDAPSSQGQGGVSLRYYWDQIQTEFGAYYIRYHNKIPYSGFLATPVPIFPLAGVPIGYFRDYADEIDMVGFSFATTLMNIAIQGEVTYRPNDAAPIVASGLAMEQAVANQGLGRVTGYVREKRVQAQMSFVGNLSSSTRWGAGYIVQALAAQDIQFLGEIALISYPDLKRQCIERSGGFPAVVGPQPCVPYAGTGVSNSLVAKNSGGFNVLMRVNYADPFGIPITVTPSVGWSKDFSGTAANQTFIDGRQSVNVGIELDYLQVWGFKANYANFFGAGNENFSRDRDFFAMSISYSF
jgi:hypothetical protein